VPRDFTGNPPSRRSAMRLREYVGSSGSPWTFAWTPPRLILNTLHGRHHQVSVPRRRRAGGRSSRDVTVQDLMMRSLIRTGCRCGSWRLARANALDQGRFLHPNCASGVGIAHNPTCASQCEFLAVVSVCGSRAGPDRARPCTAPPSAECRTTYGLPCPERRLRLTATAGPLLRRRLRPG